MKSQHLDDAYNLIAPWYDLEHASFEDDRDLYLSYAANAGSPILEIGCGSGRLLVPLAEEGYTLTGVDQSAVMLDRCRAAVDDADIMEQVTLVQGDMTHLDLPEKQFRMAFIALGSFGHLATLDERRATLRAVRAHVVAGATLILDLAQAEPRRCAQLAELGQVAHAGTLRDPASGDLLTHTIAARPGSHPGTYAITHWYDVYAQGGPLTRTCVETTLAQITRDEIALLLDATGWRLRQIYGDHALGEWDETSPRLIVVAQAAER